MLSFINLNKSFNKQVVLNNTSFELGTKGLYVFKADNGSGKTTFAKILSGEISFDGSIKINDEVFTNKNRSKLIDKVFYVDQKNNYVTYLNEGENRVLSKELFSHEKKPFSKVSNKKVTVLSDGEKNLMVLENVFNSNKDIIIFDEVTAFLDDKNYSLFIDKLNLLSKEKLIIFITHDDRIDITKFNSLTIINKKIVVNNMDKNNEKLYKNSAKTLLNRNKRTILHIFKKLFMSNWMTNLSATILLSFSTIFFTNTLHIYFYDISGALNEIYRDERDDFQIYIESFDRDDSMHNIFSKDDVNYFFSLNNEFLTFVNPTFDLTFDNDTKIFINESNLEKYEHNDETVIFPALENYYELPYEISDDQGTKLSLKYLKTLTPLNPEIVYGFISDYNIDIYNTDFSKKVISISQFNNLNNTNFEYAINDSIVVSSKSNYKGEVKFQKPREYKYNKLTFNELFLNNKGKLITREGISNLLQENEVVVSDAVFKRIIENKIPFDNVIVNVLKNDKDSINTLINIASTRRFTLNGRNISFNSDSRLNELNSIFTFFHINPLFLNLIYVSLSTFYILIIIAFSYIFNKKEQSNFNVLLNSGMTRKETTFLSLGNIGIVLFASLLIGFILAPFDLLNMGKNFTSFADNSLIYLYSYKVFLAYFVIYVLSLGLGFLVLKISSRGRD